MRTIKFRIIHKNKIQGYEHLTETGWKWNWIELNPDNGERWCKGVVEDSTPTAMIREQFTGLHDKNGKEIYEGDILFYSASNHSSMIVKFKDGCFVGEGPFNTLPITEYINATDFEFIEVIGNIHENTELL